MTEPKKEKKKPYCCFHNDQETFKSAIKDFRRLLGIPQHASKACAMAVCCCRKAKGDALVHRTPVTQLELLGYEGDLPSDAAFVETMKDSISLSSDVIGASAKEFLTEVFHHKQRGEESALRLVCIFKMAQQDQDYGLLEEEQTHRKSKMASKYTVPKEEKTVNRHAMLRRVIAKRKRRAECETSRTIALQNGKHLFKYDPKITDILQQVSIQFKPCVLESDKKRMSAMDEQRVSAIPITAWCQKKSLRELLSELEAKFQTVGYDPWPSVRYRKRYGALLRVSSDTSNISDAKVIDNILQYVKDTKVDDYGKKRHFNYHSKNHTQQRPVTTPTPVPAAKTTVKCYHCQQPQVTLSSATKPKPRRRKDKSQRQSQNQSKDIPRPASKIKESCRYHPGFVVNGKWSCCNRASDRYISLTEEHTAQGCVTSDFHKWSYQNKWCVKSMPSNNKHGRQQKIVRDVYCV